MLASMAEREQLRTLSACKDTTFPRDYRRIPQKIVNCQLTKYPFVSVCQRSREPNAMELAPIAEAKPIFER